MLLHWSHILITCENSSGAPLLYKSMKKEVYSLGYGHTKPAKILMSMSNIFV